MTEFETTKKNLEIKNSNSISPSMRESKLPCTVGQLLAITLPIMIAGLFAAIFVPIYVKHKKENTKFIIVNANNTSIDNNGSNTDSGNNGTNGNNVTNGESEEAEFDEFEENITNITYATLTPKGGYDNILIFLGGIRNMANDYFPFFKSESTFVPKRTKIYSICGFPRQMQFMIDYYNYTSPVPGWFNIDSQGILFPTEHDFTEAKVSLNIMLDEIDRIKSEENIDYRNIYLSGFSQGGMMTTYILLNSRHELGGYIIFSGYVFDHDFSENEVIYNLNDEQAKKLEDRMDYHIIASHSFKDDTVFYLQAAESYRVYFADYTNFKLISFGELLHTLPEQPSHPIVKNWLEERIKESKGN